MRVQVSSISTKFKMRVQVSGISAELEIDKLVDKLVVFQLSWR